MKAAKFPHCVTAFFNETFFFKISLACIVFSSILGCNIMAFNSPGHGSFITSRGFMLLTKVKPPNNTGATLSA